MQDLTVYKLGIGIYFTDKVRPPRLGTGDLMRDRLTRMRIKGMRTQPSDLCFSDGKPYGNPSRWIDAIKI